MLRAVGDHMYSAGTPAWLLSALLRPTWSQISAERVAISDVVAAGSCIFELFLTSKAPSLQTFSGMYLDLLDNQMEKLQAQLQWVSHVGPDHGLAMLQHDQQLTAC